jgi:hypothetical protein
VSVERQPDESEETTWDKEKGEIRISGERHVAIDAQSLCDFLDSLVGVQVAEVIMHNLEYRLGKAEAKKFKQKNPQASLDDLINHFVEADRLSGMGMTKATWTANPRVLLVEVSNPAIRGHAGASKSFIFSWWAGALGSYTGTEFDVNGIEYDERKNIARGTLVERRLK